MKKANSYCIIKKILLVGFLLSFLSSSAIINFPHFNFKEIPTYLASKSIEVFCNHKSHFIVGSTSIGIGFCIATYIYKKYKEHYLGLLEQSKTSLLKILIMDLHKNSSSQQDQANLALGHFMDGTKQKFKNFVDEFYGSTNIKKRIQALNQIVRYQ